MWILCNNCNGKGYIVKDDSSIIACTKCNGIRTIEEYDEEVLSKISKDILSKDKSISNNDI